MGMLHSELHYFPDASRKEGVRLGSLLFVKDGDQDPRCFVGFYQADASVLIEAQKLSESEFFATIFADFSGYIRYVAENTTTTAEMTEKEAALTFIGNLPQNLRATDPEGWPPSKVFAQAAEERQSIAAFAICSEHDESKLMSANS